MFAWSSNLRASALPASIEVRAMSSSAEEVSGVDVLDVKPSSPV
jgi:hypothetical protein